MGLFSSLAGLVAAPFTGGASLAPMLIGAGAGLAKNKLIDQPAEGRSRKMNAEIMRYSPWTGMSAPGVKEAGSAFGSMLSGAAGGAMLAPGLAGIMGGAPGAGPLGASAAKNAALPTMGKISNNPWVGMTPGY